MVYLRIVINIDFVKYKKVNNEQKIVILELMIFELLIHELFHFLRRLNFIGHKAEEALTPPNEKDSKLNKLHGEIGERLIAYFFGIAKIQMITFEAGEAFRALNFSRENDIEELKTILNRTNPNGLSETSYAIFCTSGDCSIIFEFDDCRELPV